jgi:hypothetical protein
MSYIQAIGCAVPQNKFHQNALKKMVQRYHPLVSADRISGIYDAKFRQTFLCNYRNKFVR